MEEWHAAAEEELTTWAGIRGQDDEEAYLGIGRSRAPIDQPVRGQFRDVAPEDGLIGVRLSWISGAIWTVCRYARQIQDAWEDSHSWERRPQLRERVGSMLIQIWRIGSRAKSLVNEQPKNSDDDKDEWRIAKRGLRQIAALVQWRHGTPLIQIQWARGKGWENCERMITVATETEVAWQKLQTKRKARAAKEMKAWARAAPTAIAHKATKPKDEVLPLTASATKKQLGETEMQTAADRGMREWSEVWRASENDGGEGVLKTVEAIECIQKCETIKLEPITARKVREAAKSFRGNTGVGNDWLRPRHVKHLIENALGALAYILNCCEQQRRWPEQVRSVISVARAKKGGGCRLIGLSTAIYRIWSRIRHRECKMAVEQQIDRPFLAAAPSRGALEAAFSTAWCGEFAAAKDLEASCTLVDFKAYFDCIEVEEYAKGAISYGLPMSILCLNAHMYTGPRRIKVDQAVSAQTWPRRSVVPGCTWAMTHVRYHVIDHAEDILATLGMC